MRHSQGCTNRYNRDICINGTMSYECKRIQIRDDDVHLKKCTEGDVQTTTRPESAF